MITGKDISGITGGTPEESPAQQKKAVTGSPFEDLLAESLQQCRNEAAPAHKDFFSTNLFINSPLVASNGPSSERQFKESLAVVLRHEGSAFVKKDGGKGSSKFGILESTAREYGYKGDMKKLTRADAEAIYKKIWKRSGAGSLPYPLSVVHFDTYVNSPAAARKLLKKSEGDIDVYLKMRAQRYNRLAELRPAQYGKYLKGWMNRIASLKNITAEYASAKILPGMRNVQTPKLENTAT